MSEVIKDGKESNSNSVDGESADGEFEPTAEMMVDDYDDERTLEEEEAIDEQDNKEEVDNLNKEQDMPLEDLLAMYGAFPPKNSEETPAEEEIPDVPDSSDLQDEPMPEEPLPEVEEQGVATPASSGTDENANTSEDKDDSIELNSEKKKEKSELTQLYPELDSNEDNSVISRALRSGSRQQSEDDEEDEEGSGEDEEDWRKTIMIGSSYQAQVPEGLQKYGDTPPYENDDKLLWQPDVVSPDEVESYLNTYSKRSKSSQGVAALPLGTHVRDDEYALHLLLQCGHNVDEALRRQRMNPNKPVSPMTLWSEDECRNFENGLKMYGKDFHLIQQNKVRTRSVGELVQFYYLWKKTERHDIFASKTRIEKKKYIVHPGTTDYMDRFLDEGELNVIPTFNPYRGDPPDVHELIYGKGVSGVPPPIPTSSLTSATVEFVTMANNLNQQLGFSTPNSLDSLLYSNFITPIYSAPNFPKNSRLTPPKLDNRFAASLNRSASPKEGFNMPSILSSCFTPILTPSHLSSTPISLPQNYNLSKDNFNSRGTKRALSPSAQKCSQPTPKRSLSPNVGMKSLTPPSSAALAL